MSEVEALRTENARLRARLVAAGLAPPPVALPNDDELHRLIELVQRHYPKLQPNADESGTYREHFAAAMHRLSFSFRPERLNRDHGLTFFVEDCNHWLASHDLGRTSLKAFAAAIIASDIPTSDATEYPYFDVALAVGGSSRPHAPAWKLVLAEGLRKPVERRNRAPTTTQQLNPVVSIREAS